MKALLFEKTVKYSSNQRVCTKYSRNFYIFNKFFACEHFYIDFSLFNKHFKYQDLMFTICDDRNCFLGGTLSSLCHFFFPPVRLSQTISKELYIILL